MSLWVLDHGKIIERGSHEKLIQEQGTYYQLYTGAVELESGIAEKPRYLDKSV